jgi:hypothetical protein
MTSDQETSGEEQSATGAQAAPPPPSVETVPFPLQDNESIVQVVRRHWVYLWPHTIMLALWGLVPVIVIALVLSWIDQYDGLVAQIFWVASAIWIIYWAARIFLNWYRYRHDLWVITNQRIVDSKKNHPFHHRLSTADLVNVQDMTVNRSGIFQTTLNYGDIVCQTAGGGGAGEFVLSGIPDPSQVQLRVDRERDRERTRGR